MYFEECQFLTPSLSLKYQIHVYESEGAKMFSFLKTLVNDPLYRVIAFYPIITQIKLFLLINLYFSLHKRKNLL